MSLSSREKRESLEQLFWRELRRLEEETGEEVQDVIICRVYEDISSVQIRLRKTYP